MNSDDEDTLTVNENPFEGGSSINFDDSEDQRKAPLAQNAALPAGFGMMDDDEEMISATFQARNHILQQSTRPSDRIAKGWKELKDRINGTPRVLEGERTIFINDFKANESFLFMNNYVSTSKYSIISFLPKFFAGQYFKRP